jgi:hypothetical protein
MAERDFDYLDSTCTITCDAATVGWSESEAIAKATREFNHVPAVTFEA